MSLSVEQSGSRLIEFRDRIFGQFGREKIKPTPTQRFHKELSTLVKEMNPECEYMLMTALADQPYFTVKLDDGDIEVPRREAYGVLDRNGRQPDFHVFLPPEEGSAVRSAIHPGVQMPDIPIPHPIVYRVDYVLDQERKRTMETWFVRLKQPGDEELLAAAPRAPYVAERRSLFGPLKNPSNTLDALQRVW